MSILFKCRKDISTTVHLRTVSFGVVLQAVQVPQHSLHRNLLRTFELTTDTVTDHSGY